MKAKWAVNSVRCLLALGLLAVVSQVQAEQRRAESGDQRCSLLELYTSEGCSSCPPADRWVSSLQPASLVPEKVIPLAFHVDYWDYLGWADPYSRSDFTLRQRTAAKRSDSQVYTPQFTVNGKVTSNNTTRIMASVNRHFAEPAPVKLVLTADIDDARARLKLGLVEPAADGRPLQGYVAIYENQLHSEVRAGENRGRMLNHQRVVRDLVGPLPLSGQTREVERELELRRDWKKADLGYVAFVQDPASGMVLQAVEIPASSVKP